MFPGSFRAKLKSLSCRRASVLATVAYTLPFFSFHPLLAYAYFSNYTDRLKGEEWTFLTCVSLGAGRALSFLATRRSTAARAFIICGGMGLIRDADCTRIANVGHRGNGKIVSLLKKDVGDAPLLS